MKRLAAVADVLSTLALVAWIGGQAALGAFAARIVFGELDRPDAARTMSRVFHEFDSVILAGVAVLALCAIVGLVARGLDRFAQVRFGLELGLCALGLFEVFWVHAHIEAIFHEGRTLDPAFQTMHRLSERCAHVELVLLIAILAVRAWPRDRVARPTK